MTTYLRHGCVPVVVQDGVDMPFERVGAFRGSVDGGDGGDGDGAEALLRWDSFSIRVAEDDVDRLDSILRGVSETEIRRLQDGVAAVWRMFWYDVPEQPAFGPVSLFLFLFFIFICMWAIGMTYVVFFYSRGGRLECSAAGSEVAALVTSPRVVTVTGSGGSRVRRVTRSR